MDTSAQAAEMQGIPAKVYRTEQRVVIAAPMPGLQPEDILVDVGSGPSVTLHGDLRGTLKDEKDVLLDEWTPGPYHRELALPNEVDGELANVTYNNGVLVVVLPVAEHTRTAQLRLDEVSPTHGERIGHSGRDTSPDGGAGSGEATARATSNRIDTKPARPDPNVTGGATRAATGETSRASGDEL
jgi:HSP20 family protein